MKEKHVALLLIVVAAVLAASAGQVTDSLAQPVLAQCEDTLDNDGDGLTDFPDDPECVSAADDSEAADPPPPPPPQCSDGNDNDGDGATDLNDPGCSSAADDSESPDPDTRNPDIGSLAITESSEFADVRGGDTIAINPAAADGTYRVSVIASDAQSGIDKVRFDDPSGDRDIRCSTTGCDAARTYRTIYVFGDLPARPGNPYQVTAFDNAGNTASVGFTVLDDAEGPAGGGISYLDGNDDDGTIGVTFDPGSDPAGLRPGSGVLERQVVPLRNKGTVCDPFPTGWNMVTTSLTAQTVTETIGENTCARYRYRVTDNVSNETIYTSQSIARFFPQDPTPPGNVRRARMRTGDHRAVLTYRLPRAADFKQIRIYRWIAGRRLETEVRVFAGKRVKFRQYGLFNRTRYVYRIVSFDKTLNPSSGVILSGRPQSPLLKSPRDGGTLRRPPTLDWRRHSQASRYNVKLVRNGRTILSRFPRATELKIRGKWKYGGRTQKLRDGTYYWYVYPRIGTRYGTVRWSRFTKE